MTMTEEAIYKSLQNSGVPEHNHGGIVRYLIHGIAPGSFLTAVIENNLRDAFACADNDNIAHMFDTVCWFYNHAPISCSGSPEKMQAWITERREAAKAPQE